MSREVLVQHQAIWRTKPVLRRLYLEWFDEIAVQLAPGVTLEVGGGIGNLKEHSPHMVCTDVVKVPWLDAVADAQHLPFAKGSFSNIVLFDALHHIEDVGQFFDEAMRVLRPGGRIVVIDPYISWTSGLIYRLFHPEPVDVKADPFQVQPSDQRQPFDANQAMATILFEERFVEFQRRYPGLLKRVHRRFAFFAYPLSGGFRRLSFLPMLLVVPLLLLERLLGRLDRLLAFRMLVVLEKAA